MTASCKLKLGGVQITEGQNPGVELTYIVQNAADETAAIIAAALEAPLTYILPSVRVVKRNSLALTETVNATTFVVSVGYGAFDKSEPPETGDMEESWSTTGGKAHITQSLETKDKVPANAPDHGGAIGYTDNGVAGCDIVVPAPSFSETHYIDSALVTLDYKKAVEELTGTVNLNEFRGRDGFSVLFLGASGGKRGDEDYRLKFDFAVSQNFPDINTNGLGVLAKFGWEYAWFQYETTKDEASNRMVKTPLAAYSEKVYFPKDWGPLLI